METKKLILTFDIAKERRLRSLETLIIPSNIIDKDNDINYVVTEIDDDAFSECHNLKNLIIPSTITEIGCHAFRDCINLTNVRFCNGLKVIQGFAFSNTSIKNVTFPKSINYIGTYAFCHCEKLEKIEFLPQENDTEIVIDDGCFKECSLLKKINLPQNLEFLPTDLVTNCISLEKLTIPNNVRVIEESSIKDCSNLTELILPDSLSTIATNAINNCKLLNEVTWRGFSFIKDEWNGLKLAKDSWI